MAKRGYPKQKVKVNKIKVGIKDLKGVQDNVVRAWCQRWN